MKESLKRLARFLLAPLLPRYRKGNYYDLVRNWGAFRIYELPPNPEVMVCVPFGIVWLTIEWPLQIRWISYAFLRRIMPPEYAILVERLHPHVVRTFLLAHDDRSGHNNPTIPGRYIDAADTAINMLRVQGASDGTHIIYLEKDFGGYFHFLIEIIPFIVSVGEQVSVKVSISPELNAKYDFIVSVLVETRIPFLLGVAPDGRDLRVKDLVRTSELAYYYPNLASVQILRQALKAKAPNGIQGHRRRLFLSRRDNEGTQGRVLANQTEIAAILDSMGFTPYYAEDYTFDQQRNDFSAAEIVVGVHGAGLSNVVFMDRGATLVELMPKTEFKWHFALLASYCQVNYVLLPIDTLDTINGGRPKRVLANQAELAKCVRQQIDALGSERHTGL